jgi:hypothetical protein
MDDWRTDKALADRFMPEIKQILSEHLIKDAPVEEDAERNTDLIVLGMKNIRVAVRVSKDSYWEGGKTASRFNSERI